MASYDDTATVSGSVVSFANGADDVPLKKCEITVPASLDGYSSVDVKHCGKNLLPMVNYDGGVYNPDIGRQLNLTVSETQFTKNGNVYSVTTSVSWKTFTVLLPLISGVTYYEKWTLSIESGQQGSTRAYLDEDFKVLARYNSNSSDPITTNGVMSPPTGTKYLAITLTNRGTAVQTLKITEPMIEIGSSASAWEEYNGATHTASLGRTIYGGTADIVNGVGTDENGNDFTFDGQEIPTRLGYNAFWSEQGDSEVTYYKDGYGFTSVTVNKTGKNLIYPKYSGRSSNGITYVVNSDHSVTCSGISTNTSWAAANLTTKPEFMQLIPKGTYCLTGGISSDIQIYLSGVYVDDGTAITQRADTGSGATYTFEKSVLVYPQIRIASGVDLTTPVTIRFQLELGSQATEYEPYEAVSKTAYLHKVIYGGTADVIRGTCEPKNLFDDSTFPRTATDNTYYAQFQSNLAEGNKYKIPTIHIEPDVAYVLSFDVECNTEPFNASVGIGNGSYSKDITNAINNTSGRISVPFTLTSALKEQYGDILSFRVPRYNSPREFTFTLSNVQLEKASSASEYVPHFEPFSFPPIGMETDEGENTLFANEGASAITYRKETD